MKKILGLDLGTTSIGWALVNESEIENESSSIIKTGVRIIPLSTDESNDFEKGKAISINADRTTKRGTRRNLQRYKIRRKQLLNVLKENKLIDNKSVLTETGPNSTHSLLSLRAKAVNEEISLENFARVLLAINKKRGYKSNRKAKDDTDGQAIDGIHIAIELYEKNLTPGQFVYERLKQDKKAIPDFYRSDLQNEFDAIWKKQSESYPDILTIKLKESLKNKNKGQSWKICEKPFNIVGIKQSGTVQQKKLELYKWRTQALKEKIDLEHLAIVLQEINSQINNSSGYLGEISDRSKQLYLNKITVGQYLYEQIKNNPHTPLKNQVFYRQDYLDEFERIWETQSKNRKDILTNELKEQIRDIIIFYQRRLKSQKGLISICEFERRDIEIEIDGKRKKKTIGPRVIPKSSPLFQEFRIWQILNNLKFENTETHTSYPISELDQDVSIREQMFDILNTKGKLSPKEVLNIVIEDPEKWEIKNFKELEGNSTNQKLFKAYSQIVESSGHSVNNKKLKESYADIFKTIGINPDILEFDTELKGNLFEKQASYQLWHLIYSYEGDNSETGNDKLYELLYNKFGFDKDYAKLLINISFQDDYGNLSTKAIKKILPYLKAGHEYSQACLLAGYNHSHSITKEDNERRPLDDILELLPKNSLRNPVVEKILNQMINVINAIIEQYGKPDEIRIELARELKKNAEERAEMTRQITKTTAEHNEIREKLKEIYPFNTGIRITKNDIIKHKLREELATNGYKTIYTNTYVPLEKLFTKEFDIEHIIPKTVLFDDSFSNKTIAVRDFNRIKSNKTGIDAVAEKYGNDSDEFKRYVNTVEKLYENNKISKAKHKKLLMTADKIPDGFIERDLRNSQYIAKKAQEILRKIAKTVTPTTGIITDKLREDWQLINVLQELNWEKYAKLELTDFEFNKEGKKIPVIKDWSKRNDHRHHAMDAITVAFTKPSLIQYFNYLSARKNEKHKKHSNIYAIEQKETFVNDKNKRLIKPPIPIEEFRAEAKKQLESILVSFKAKNKVVTRNINKTRKKSGENKKIELTPRGQLHDETIYGRSCHYTTIEEKVGSKFTKDYINNVAIKSQKEALLKRLNEFDGDAKLAFTGKNSPSKNPIYLDEHQSAKLPEKVKFVVLEESYTIRKEISPNLKIDKVIDKKIRKILNKRLKQFNNDPQKAFSNLEENPIWLIEPTEKSKWENPDKPKSHELGIPIKRVTITGISNAEALHNKKDHFGNKIADSNGKVIPTDFVSPGNNHHIAIYKDEEGKLYEDVISFYDAVTRVNQGSPIVWHTHPEHPDWELMFTLKKNEYFIFPDPGKGFNPSEIDLMNEENYHFISPHLFRVQKIGKKDYWFRHHLETKIEDTKKLAGITYKRMQSLESIKNIIKVRINHLGQIVKIGEY